MLSVLSENKKKNKKLFLNLTELVNALEKENDKFFNTKLIRTVSL